MQRVGLDLANGFIKVSVEGQKPLVYENRLTQLNGTEFSVMGLEQDTIYEVMGEKYQISPTGISSGGRNSDRYLTEQYLVECLIALSRVTTEADVSLCVGLPARDYQTTGLREKIADQLTGCHEVKVNDEAKIINIESVKVTYEPLGTLLTVIYDNNLQVIGDRDQYSYLIIDIGFGTTDILGTKQGIRPTKIAHAEVGMMDCLNHYLTLINNRMKSEGDNSRFDANDVTLMLKSEVRKYGRVYDFSHELERAKNYTAKLVESNISQAGVNLNDYDRVLYTGGGATALHHYLSMPHNARLNPQAQIGNAVGYLKYLQLRGA